MQIILPDRRFFVPEIVQSSTMDCGPAALKSILGGFGINANYDRLREACQTDVDGTSIDTIEVIAVHLGLLAEQVMVPLDHVCMREAKTLPAIVVVRLPNGNTHFVVAWNQVGSFVQVMDPASGRYWNTRSQFVSNIYVHRFAVAATAWREWAGTDEFQEPLQARLLQLGLSRQVAPQLLTTALSDSSWLSLAALDASTRMITSIVRAKGLQSRRETTSVLTHLFENTRSSPTNLYALVPSEYWSVIYDATSPEEEQQVNLIGAVLVRVLGQKRDKEQSYATSAEDSAASAGEVLSPDLTVVQEEAPFRSVFEFMQLLSSDGPGALLVLLASGLLTAVGFFIDILIFRSIINIGAELRLSEQRLIFTGAVLLLLTGTLVIELLSTRAMLWLGRRLEIRLRITLLTKIPRLGDRYFHSRLVSDMAERSHAIHRLRQFSWLINALFQSVMSLVITLIAIIWLNPDSIRLALVAAFAAVGLPMIAYPVLAERDLRIRSHLGALSRFYLDGLLGLAPIRVHHAERRVRREHEGVLIEWARASYRFFDSAAAIEGIQAFIGLGLAIWLVLSSIQIDELASALLLIYWALNLPIIGSEIAQLMRQYPVLRNTLLRLIEPLGATESHLLESPSVVCEDEFIVPAKSTVDQGGVAVEFRNVSVRLSGHTVLKGINLSIKAGSHVAIVGPSGAGKSTFVGLLLGWRQAFAGVVLIDEEPLIENGISRLRRQIAWVDPSVQLWNQTFIENLSYGASPEEVRSVGSAITRADLQAVLDRLPDGMQSILGENGGLVSGGEGQRVRLGRAMLRQGVRLAILDEPFRGLDRRQRRMLLNNARELWKDATLFCVTHDMNETLSFDQVVVIQEGQIVESGIPVELADNADSAYCQLLQSEKSVHSQLWTSNVWRRFRFSNGRLEAESNSDL